MKRLLTVLLFCCFSSALFAQATSLRVTNTTNCWVYYVIRANNLGNCSILYASNFIALAPGGSISYSNSSFVPGFPPAPLYSLNGADLYVRPLSCGAPDILRVGEPCSGYPPSVTYPVYNMGCTVCNPSVTAKWATGGPGGTATLTFF